MTLRLILFEKSIQSQRRNRFDRRGKFEKPAKTGKWTEKDDKKPAKETLPRKPEGKGKLIIELSDYGIFR